MPYSKRTLETRGDEIKRRGVAKSMKHRMTPRGKFLAHCALARRRGIACTISFEEFQEFVAKDECRWCGGSLPTSRAGLDRLNNDLGYVPGNCAPCCWSCNMMKGTLSAQEFVDLCRKIVARANLPEGRE